MGRLIKYELKKQQTSRNIILALLLVFLLAVVVGTFTENGNTVGISVMLEMFVGMFVFFYMGIESLLILNRDLKTKQSHMLWMEDPGSKVHCSNFTDFLYFSSIRAGSNSLHFEFDCKNGCMGRAF